MIQKRDYLGWVTVGVIGVALGGIPLLYTRLGVDAFEVPKRLAWAVVGVALWVLSVGRGGARNVSGSGAWLGVRWGVWVTGVTVCAGPLFRGANGWGCWMLPLCLFGVGAMLRLAVRQKAVLGWVCLVAGGLQSGLMLLQRFGMDPLFAETTLSIAYLPGRMIGTIGYQNQAAEFLVLCTAGWFWVRPTNRMRWFAISLVALCVLSVILTANRGAILALGVGWGVVAGMQLWKTRHACIEKCFVKRMLFGSAAIAIAALLLFCGVVPELRERLAEVVTPSESVAVRTRLVLWKVAVQIWKESPWVGVGAGGYAWRYMTTLAEMLPEKKDHALLQSLVFAREAHNDVLQFGCEFGWIGLILCGAGVWMLVRDIGKERDEEEKCARMSCFVLSAMFVASLFSFTWQTGVAGPMAGLFVGLSLRERTTRHSTKWGWIPTCGIGIMLVGLMALAFYDATWNQNENYSRFGTAHGRWKAMQAAAMGVRGKFSQSEQALRETLLEYQDVRVYSNLGNVLVQQGKFSEALEVYRFWMKTGLDYSEAMRNCIVVLEKSGNLEEAALMRYQRMLQFPQEFSDRDILHTASALIRVHHDYEADCVVHSFRSLCLKRKLEAWTPEWDNLCGVLAQRKGDYETALLLYEKALQRNPDLPSAQKNAHQLKAKLQR